MPGSGFGLAPCFRLSYASPEQNFREAAKRIAKALREPS
ncbi:aspartate/methionine/tyrosine aminotransferase [Bradyrhizobium sp. i1.15.2]